MTPIAGYAVVIMAFNNAPLPWFPFDADPLVDELVAAYKESLSKRSPQLDTNLAYRAAVLLTQAVAPYAREIIERDSLPSLCHLVNGWGNAKVPEGALLQLYRDFVATNGRGRASIPQCEPEGDFHAGQSLAYALMAGLEWASPVISSKGPSLIELLQEVQELPVDDAAELGHFLFAVGWTSLRYGAQPFRLGARELSFTDLIAEAIESHYSGHFNVCRKFHLTEGLCALSSSPFYGSDTLRTYARNFLDGQLSTLYIIGAIRSEVTNLLAGCGNVNHLDYLRSHALIGNFIENEYYYVGHAAELAGVALMCGFYIETEHRYVLNELINVLNAELPVYLGVIDIRETFLHFGHYRRGTTMILEADYCTGRSRDEWRVALSKYTADFVTPPAQLDELPFDGMNSKSPPPVYQVARPQIKNNAFLDTIHAHFSTSRFGREFYPRGTAGHFRRFIRSNWDRHVHYEILLAADHVGIELHSELPITHPKASLVRNLLDEMAASTQLRGVHFDPLWLDNGCRLQIILDKDINPEEALDALTFLIEDTFTKVNMVWCY